MKNIEKYIEDIISYTDSKIEQCAIFCEERTLENFKTKYSQLIREFLEENNESPKITKFEFDYLKHTFEVGGNYIARNKDGHISLFAQKPTDEDGYWDHDDNDTIPIFNDLFQFTKYNGKQPYEIKWVLDNCQVVQESQKGEIENKILKIALNELWFKTVKVELSIPKEKVHDIEESIHALNSTYRDGYDIPEDKCYKAIELLRSNGAEIINIEDNDDLFEFYRNDGIYIEDKNID